MIAHLLQSFWPSIPTSYWSDNSRQKLFAALTRRRVVRSTLQVQATYQVGGEASRPRSFI